MPRQARFYYPGAVLHVVQRGNNRTAVFTCPRDHRFYLDCLRDAMHRHRVSVHAYVLMTNHVHLLVSPNDGQGLPLMMQSLGRNYVSSFNLLHGRTGTLWEGRYKAAPVDTDHYLFACYRYMELNPVRAGIVTSPHAYHWSSHRANACGDHDPVVTPHAAFIALASSVANRRDAYRRMFDEPLAGDSVDAIRDAARHEWALGGPAFRAHVETLTGRRGGRLPRGRPPANSQKFVSDPI